MPEFAEYATPAERLPSLVANGLVVSPGLRRRGIGLELTRHRLDDIFERAAVAYYYATAINRVTIELHARLGFHELTRDSWAPGTSFTGGAGILFELGREQYAAFSS